MPPILEGYVRRRRDNISWVWSERYLILENNSTLLLFKRRGDPVPRRTIILSPGCSVEQIPASANAGKKEGTDKIFQFKVNFSRDHRDFHLGSRKESIEFGTSSEEETEKWISAIDIAIQRSEALGARKSAVKAEVGDTPATIAALLQQDAKRGLLRTRNQSIKGGDSSGGAATAGDDAGRSSFASFHQGPESAEDEGLEEGDDVAKWRVVGTDGALSILEETSAAAEEDLAAAALKHAESHNFLVMKILITAAGSFLALSSFFSSSLWVAGALSLFASFLVGVSVISVPRNLSIPALRTSLSVAGDPDDVFRVVHDISRFDRWDCAFLSMKVVETVDAHTDIVYGVLRPVWTWPFFHRPRDVVFTRYWRKEKDGTYLIVWQSTSHPSCPPTKKYIRSSIPGYMMIFAPIRPQFDVQLNRCLLTIVMRYDPAGWSRWWTKLHGNQLLYTLPFLRNAVTINDGLTRQKFLEPSLSKSSLKTGVSVDHSGLVLGVEKLPSSCSDKFWAEPAANNFKVRGPTYLSDKQKIDSGSSLFHLVAFEVLSFEDPTARFNIGARPDSLNNLHQRGEPTDADFCLILSLVIPSSDNLAIVMYYKPSSPSWREDKSPAWELFHDFLDADNDFRNTRFKLIPRVVDGSFLIQSAVGSKPAIIGNKGLQIPYYKGERYFEIDIDIDSDRIARQVVGMCLGVTKSLVVDIGFVIEGKTAEELPENVLGTVRIKNIDLKKVMKRIPA